jgi:hypothetical protein
VAHHTPPDAVGRFRLPAITHLLPRQLKSLDCHEFKAIQKSIFFPSTLQNNNALGYENHVVCHCFSKQTVAASAARISKEITSKYS